MTVFPRALGRASLAPSGLAVLLAHVVLAAAPSSAVPGPANPDARRSYPTVPNDPLFAPRDMLTVSGQWGLHLIRAPQAWQERRATGAGIKVAVLDTGIDLGHPDLSCPGKVRIVRGAAPSGGRPTDLDGHGTHVAGIIAACTNNRTGVAGVAPDVTLLPFRAVAPDATAATVAVAVQDAVAAGAHVINMSFGFSEPGAVASIQSRLGSYRALTSAVAYAQDRGVVVVASAGNRRSPLCGYPALADGVVCVGATDRRDLSTWYSTFPVKADGGRPGEGPSVVAPGGAGIVACQLNNEGILSTFARALDACDEGAAGYRMVAGTSMAAPHVAGVAALVYDRLGGLRTKQNAAAAVHALRSSAVDLGPPGWDPVYGFGRVDALAAVRSAVGLGRSGAVLPAQSRRPVSPRRAT